MRRAHPLTWRQPTHCCGITAPRWTRSRNSGARRLEPFGSSSLSRRGARGSCLRCHLCTGCKIGSVEVDVETGHMSGLQVSHKVPSSLKPGFTVRLWGVTRVHAAGRRALRTWASRQTLAWTCEGVGPHHGKLCMNRRRESGRWLTAKACASGSCRLSAPASRTSARKRPRLMTRHPGMGLASPRSRQPPEGIST